MKELNLTQGSVPKVLLQFAVPFLIANVLQALYGGADLFWAGGERKNQYQSSSLSRLSTAVNASLGRNREFLSPEFS